MEKQELLEQVRQMVGQGVLSKNELMEVCEKVTKDQKAATLEQQSRMSAILYFIGGMIIFLGIVIFVRQNWSQLDSVAKILVTLGAAIAAYAMGIAFSYYEKLEIVSQAFYFISGLLAPLGLTITFDIAGLQVYKPLIQSLMASIAFTVYMASYLLLRKEVFLVFSIIFGSWLFYAITGYIIEGGDIWHDWRLWMYRVLFAHGTYLLLGYYYQDHQKVSLVTLSRWLYGFGAFGFLGAALLLGGWKADQNLFWEVTYPIWVFGMFYLSIYLKNRVFLVSGTLYLMAYILKITSEYFTEGFGWALSLIVAGLALMGIGYLAFYLNRKYLTETKGAV